MRSTDEEAPFLKGMLSLAYKQIKELREENERRKKTEQFLRSERPIARKLTELEAEVERLRVSAINVVNAYSDPHTSFAGVTRAIDELRKLVALTAQGGEEFNAN